MTFLRIFTTTSALALAAGPALADLSAEEVWADWQDLLGSYGAEVSTGGESYSGGTLTVTDIVAGFTIDGGAMSLDLGSITFAEQGDGSVAITMADTMPFEVDVTAEDGTKGRVGFTLNQPGARLVASGDTENLRYDFDYPTMSMTDFTLEGEDIPENIPFTFDMIGTGLTGYLTLGSGDIRNYETESRFDTFTLNMDGADPDEGSGSIVFNMSDLVQTSRGTFADVEMDMSAAELIEAGLTQISSGTYGPSTYEMAFEGPDGAFEFAAALTGGTIDVSFDENGLAYGGIANGITMTVGGSAIPFPPLSFAMQQSESRVTMPLVPGDEEQGFAFVTTLIGLEIDNMLWSMFDPAGQLPRDPATLVVDVSGSVVLTEDFTDPDYAENANAAPPGTIESLDINSIQLKLAGAELNADGDFAFNNTTGMPVPSGTANMMLTGGNALLDTLVGMGLVPEEQAMGARMMLGLFARPGDGPDTLVSTIEVNEDGSILANGQRIK